MKNGIYLLLISFTMSVYSCKKQETSIKKDTSIKDVSLENGHLAFKDYSSFISYYKAVGSMNKFQRQQWEKSLGFSSMKTAYENFNKELDELEKGSKEDYHKGFANLKEKYNGTLLFTEDSYRLNSSGLAESILANKNGLVKIGQDYLYFTEQGIATLSNTSLKDAQRLINQNSVGGSGKLSSVPNSTMDILGMPIPSINSFTATIGPWNFVYKDRGRVVFRTKAYNLHRINLDYQSFAALEGMAQHKNVFGTWRDVGMSVGFTPVSGSVSTPSISISHQNTANNLQDIAPPVPPRNRRLTVGNVDLNLNFFSGLANVEHFDRVLCISKGLEINPQITYSIVGNLTSEFSYHVIDTMFMNYTDVYWSGVDLSGTWLSVFIQPGGVLGNPEVLFNPFRLDSGVEKNIYQ